MLLLVHQSIPKWLRTAPHPQIIPTSPSNVRGAIIEHPKNTLPRVGGAFNAIADTSTCAIGALEPRSEAQRIAVYASPMFVAPESSCCITHARVPSLARLAPIAKTTHVSAVPAFSQELPNRTCLMIFFTNRGPDPVRQSMCRFRPSLHYRDVLREMRAPALATAANGG